MTIFYLIKLLPVTDQRITIKIILTLNRNSPLNKLLAVLKINHVMCVCLRDWINGDNELMF